MKKKKKIKKIEEIKKTEININDIKIKNENLFYRCLNKINSDKKITDQFIADFVLEKSNIILIVVGQMTINEQLLINELKEKIFDDHREIIVIHNLFNFVKKSQVENYINDVLKKSIYFNLEEKEFNFRYNENEIQKDFNKKYFIDLDLNQKNVNKFTHLIFANDSLESEAGNFYNYSTILYIKNKINSFPNHRTFDVIEDLRSFLFDEFFKYFKDKNGKKDNNSNLKIVEINKNNVIQNENELKKKFIMKINENSNLQTLSNILLPKDYFKYSRKIFIPSYSYYKEFVNENFLYKNGKKNKNIEVLVIAIELAGKIENLREKINILKNGYYKVLITGVKKFSKNNKMFDYESNIEDEFKIEFEIDMNEKN